MAHTFCIFGDSTAWGAWDLEKGGWVNRLWLHIANKDDYNPLYNLSISGGTTETILGRFENEANIRFKAEEDGNNTNVLIFQTGGNDSAYNPKDDKNLVTLEKFTSNIQKIIRRSRKITPHIIFIGFKNCDETRTTPVSWVNLHYTNDSIQKYNDAMKKACEAESVAYIDIFGILEPTDLEDGLHPNASGHEKLFRKILDSLGSLKYI